MYPEIVFARPLWVAISNLKVLSDIRQSRFKCEKGKINISFPNYKSKPSFKCVYYYAKFKLKKTNLKTAYINVSFWNEL